ncbi:Putative uncharacterized protein [Taphrina deformans PYCC 5710]|uniref:Ribosomal protein L1 n=1 Tax=Taphrina deformans (strain PYCC 5710 / ATCC 11124 / CBS 356.35 / IMI 108563 / JCM 9778 / NBRC 8474) TaxID=1097556 RepID=R4XF52_TAPDE|nr:Putative uncharacterized protein [Taphrina deformans PYCC 5710]|eukprot:CCG81987.1 Putative uncharacterized protein [Taphrina deformans PYCC 5710]
MVGTKANKSPATTKLDSEQVSKASKALLKHIHSATPKAEKTNLLASDVDAPENDTAIWLSLTTKKFIVDKKRLKPARLPLAHPFTPEDATVCLFVKDPQRTYKDMIEQAGLSSVVTRVVGISKLKEKHKSYEAKRALRDSHDIFMADDRVVSLLPSLLGKTFYAAKKNPLPISVPTKPEKSENLKIEINKALGSTSLHLAPGTCTMIRVGIAGQTAEQLAENIELVANRVIDQYVPQKWSGVRSLHIKTSSSVALPIWQTDAIFDPETDKVAAEKESSLSIEDGSVQSKKRKANKSVPGISVEAVDEVTEGTPTKKAKTAEAKPQTSKDQGKAATKAKAPVKKPAVVAPQIVNKGPKKARKA